jgi:Zn-finger nucleic acid-binding protein
MNCPKCPSSPLKPLKKFIEDHSKPGAQTTALELETCSGCDGIWFDHSELDKFLLAKVAAHAPDAKPAAGRAAASSVKAGSCPKCPAQGDRPAPGLHARPAAYDPSITVDACGQCEGVWVDGAELSRVGGQELPFEGRMKALFGDLK